MRRDFGPKRNDFLISSSQERGLLHLPQDEPRRLGGDHGRHRLLELFRIQNKERLPYGDPNLPIASRLDEIGSAVVDNPVVLIAGETGSGKSTQVPLKLLDLGIPSDMMQPRRLAADLVAQRIDYHVRERKGDKGEGIVGCLTADKNTVMPNTQARVLTDGVLIRLLPEILKSENPPAIIIDEVHEWKIETEIALALIKKRIAVDPNFRLLIMSATPDQKVLFDFFGDVLQEPIKTIEVPVAIHEIEDKSEPESTVAEQAFMYGSEGKNVLCFVEGKREIEDAIDAIRRQFRKENKPMPTILPLHAKLSAKQREAALASYSNGKIIVATDVAQTSITIPDIDVVVDCGRKREPHIDDEFSDSLDIVLASRSDMRQRRGRCGRVKEGIYVHTRGTKNDTFVAIDDESRPEYSVPEIQRTEVDRVVLYVANLGYDMAELDFPHKVDQKVIAHAKEKLRILGALDENGAITPLGQKMEALPMSPVLARMVVESEQYSTKTRAQVAAIAVAVEAGGMQYFAHNVGRRWKDLVSQSDSDMLAQLELFISAKDLRKHEQVEYNLDPLNIEKAREQYRKVAQKLGIDPAQLEYPSQTEVENIKRCIYAGMIDYVYEYVGDNQYVRAGGNPPTPREISDRSIVDKRGSVIVGFPYKYDYQHKNEMIPKHIIEKVTRVDIPAVLGEVAAHLCIWKPTNTIMRKGRLVQNQEQHFGSISLGVIREVEAEVNDESVAYLVEHMMKRPGSALRELYAINEDIKALRKLSPKAPDVIYDEIKKIVEEAVTASGLDESYADHLIRERIARENISLERYISHEQLTEIYDNSPNTIESFGYTFNLEYTRGIPLIKRFDLSVATQFDREVTLADGRIVKFVGEHGKHFTVADLKRIAAEE